MKVLHIDNNHPLLMEGLAKAGFDNLEASKASREEILGMIGSFDGVVIRSRIKIDREFLDEAGALKFIARVGAGLESIDEEYAKAKGILLFSAPEGNRNAVGEHALGMLLSLLNKLNKADKEVRAGLWNREANRGIELEGKTVGIIGYGNMGKAFAKKLSGFDCQVLCHDILDGLGDEYARQVALTELKEEADILSLHTPLTSLTKGMVNRSYIDSFKKPFWLINTARGKSVITADLVNALQSGKILGAALDVLEYEKSSFESLFDKGDTPEELRQLFEMDQVLLSPHIAGWTQESKIKLAQVILDKICSHFLS